MAIESGNKKVDDVGTWQEIFKPVRSERVEKARERVRKEAEICLERVRAELKAYNRYKDQPAIIQRARFLETFLKDKSIHILEDELIVGTIGSKPRSAFVTTANVPSIAEEMDDPDKDFSTRPYDKILIHPDERRELREEIIPAVMGGNLSLFEYNVKHVDQDILEHTAPGVSACPHIPIIGDVSMTREAGHMFLNFEKALYKGLKGIREEVREKMAELDQPYRRFDRKQRQEFYESVLITLDAATEYFQKYAGLAREIAAEEVDPTRKKELERIAEICERVPEHPARDWWEALQSIWFLFSLSWMEHATFAVHFLGRIDQILYPFYKKTVEDEKKITREEALELLECFLVKFNEPAWALNYEWSQWATGQGLSQTMVIGGQTREGKDACNEVTLLVLEAMQQLRLNQPEFAMRIWEGTPDTYLKKATELIRLGLGYPKLIGDRKGIQMAAKAYPDLTIEDWRQFAVAGCSEIGLPYITMDNAYEAIALASKWVELILSNGKCALCGKQIGLETGDPRQFETMDQVKDAYRKQVFYWGEYMAKAEKVFKENQSEWYPAPFCSALTEGPLDRGRDITRGGAWYTLYGFLLASLADAADSLGVIDTLIYRDHRITWDQLIEAVNTNWEGYENLRQLCVNGVSKYGNDDDYADGWAVWIADVWADLIDWLNTRKDLIPKWGGKYLAGGLVAISSTQFGESIGATPNGRKYPLPVADTCSPVQGVDRNGPSAVVKSFSKIPTHRWALSGLINIRLNPNLFQTDDDLEKFAAFIRACEELGLYHVQFNIISAELLRNAMKEPEKHRDLLVRVASYVAYFVELSPNQQMDIINRTEQQGW
jgi:pyruvate formate-lyase/glycerol dehydratase family glycyl radical enzyme